MTDRFKTTQRVALLGIIVNIVLLILKLSIGFLSYSQAMIADGFNSAGDVFASFMTYTGNKISGIPADKNHPYGHGKAEYIFSMIISFSLLLVAYGVLKGSFQAVIKGNRFLFSWWLIAIAVFTIITKFVLYIYTKRAAKRNDNLLILANSEDHRNDVFITSSTLLGIICGNFGIYSIDGLVGIGISLWIAFSGIKIFFKAYHVLMDTSIDDKLKNDVMRTAENISGVDHIDSIIAKPVGVGYIIIIKVSVAGNLSVYESHSIAARIRERVRICKNVKDVLVHINPT